MTYSMSLRSKQSVAAGGAKRNPEFHAPDESKPALVGERFCRPLKRALKQLWLPVPRVPLASFTSPWAILCRPLRGLVDVYSSVELNPTKLSGRSITFEPNHRRW